MFESSSHDSPSSSSRAPGRWSRRAALLAAALGLAGCVEDLGFGAKLSTVRAGASGKHELVFLFERPSVSPGEEKTYVVRRGPRADLPERGRVQYDLPGPPSDEMLSPVPGSKVKLAFAYVFATDPGAFKDGEIVRGQLADAEAGDKLKGEHEVWARAASNQQLLYVDTDVTENGWESYWISPPMKKGYAVGNVGRFQAKTSGAPGAETLSKVRGDCLGRAKTDEARAYCESLRTVSAIDEVTLSPDTFNWPSPPPLEMFMYTHEPYETPRPPRPAPPAGNPPPGATK